MAANGITTPEQRAAFLAQVAVESNQLQTTTENLNYTTAQRLQQVFGRTHFPSPDAAAPFLRNPEALANRVYANRNGNGDEASGDGYRGRGLMQTTGRENYRAAGHENDPETLEAPQGAADAAAQFWASHGLNGQTTGPLTNSNSTRYQEPSTGTIPICRRGGTPTNVPSGHSVATGEGPSSSRSGAPWGGT